MPTLSTTARSAAILCVRCLTCLTWLAWVLFSHVSMFGIVTVALGYTLFRALSGPHDTFLVILLGVGLVYSTLALMLSALCAWTKR